MQTFLKLPKTFPKTQKSDYYNTATSKTFFLKSCLRIDGIFSPRIFLSFNILPRFSLKVVILITNSPRKVFLLKVVLKICKKFTGEHQCRSVISIKLQSNFVNLLRIFSTYFYRNTYGRLLLIFRKIGKLYVQTINSPEQQITAGKAYLDVLPFIT